MSRPLPDIVVDTRLPSQVFPKYTVHMTNVLEPDTGKRFDKVEERWRRKRELGLGGFGTVWLEQCELGPRKGSLRAVKEIRCNRKDSPVEEFARELEAIGKFSQPMVSSFAMLIPSPTYPN